MNNIKQIEELRAYLKKLRAAHWHTKGMPVKALNMAIYSALIEWKKLATFETKIGRELRDDCIGWLKSCGADDAEASCTTADIVNYVRHMIEKLYGEYESMDFYFDKGNMYFVIRFTLSAFPGEQE